MKKILLCLFTLPFLINAQDSCPNAVTIVPNNNYCGTNDHEGSFDDGSYTDNPCEDYYNDGEYWFEYTGNGNALTFDVTSLTSTYSGLFVLDACPSSAPNCIASYTSGSSTNDFTLTTPALTNGQTYYIVMANWGTPYSTDFCLTASESTPPTPPAGCVDATELPCGTTNLSGSTIGTTDVAHETGCSMSNYGTWYTFVGDGQQTTINVTTTSYDIELSVSSGSCGSLTNIACQDDEVSSGTETYTFTTTIGETYYVYIAYWSTTGSTTGDFTISRTCTEAPETPEVTAPGGQVCDDAEAFCSGNYLFPNITDVTEAQSGPEYGCVSNTKNPVWYYMEIENGGVMELTISQTNTSGSGTDVDFVMWGPFPNPTTACTSIEGGVAPIQSAYSANDIEIVGIGVEGGSFLSSTTCIGVTTPPPAAAGETYVVMITNYNGSEGFISFSQTGGDATTNCDIVVLGNVINLKGQSTKSGNMLSWNLFGHEKTIAYYNLMRSNDGQFWTLAKKVEINGNDQSKTHQILDRSYTNNSINYYKVITVKTDGTADETEIIQIDNRIENKQVVKVVNLLGQEVDKSYEGILIYIYSDGSTVKKYNTLKN